MENRRYKCEYCLEKFVPKRRRIQKYCSASCRSKAYHYRKTLHLKPELKTSTGLKGIETESKIEMTENKRQGMSFAGVGNATAGTIAADLLTKAFTVEHKRPATKEDIQQIVNRLGRFHLITNMPPQPNRDLPYYDSENKSIVYRNPALTKGY